MREPYELESERGATCDACAGGDLARRLVMRFHPTDGEDLWVA